MINYLKLLIFLIAFSATTFARSNFDIATINIKWFGLAGEISADFGDEYRSAWISEYIEENLSHMEAILFQEIVDVQLLEGLMNEFNMQCTSYEVKQKRHQHIVLCLNNSYEFIKERDEDNQILDSVGKVTRGQLRPALYGKIRRRGSKKSLFHLVGVHLKANAKSSHIRQKQVSLIKERIEEFQDSLPIVVLGDFNSFDKKSTKKKKDDVNLFDDIFSEVDLYRVKHNFKYTFRSKTSKLLLDHAWVSEDIDVDEVEVGKACSNDYRSTYRFDNPSFYNRFVSDHCPLSFRLNL